jgi:hypothetical protein
MSYSSNEARNFLKDKFAIGLLYQFFRVLQSGGAGEQGETSLNAQQIMKPSAINIPNNLIQQCLKSLW